MNRHHPYGSSYESIPPRRGGSPSGPGPDRSHRFQDSRGGAPARGGRGFGRGRGGYQNYEGSMSGHSAYDQPPQADMGNYNDYDQAANYYQNPYGAPPQNNQYAAPNAPYNQAYPKLEDGVGPSYDDEGDFGRGARRPIRKERDDKVHDSIIEERIQRERPCRTLFIRNIKYETNSDDVRRQFEEHGAIKTFFDLISTRGMVFVTYFDLRAAERARERLQGSEISGRPIDVHYSLPRDDQRDREKNQQLQGTLQVTLRNSASGQPIDDNEVRRKFQQFGDVKAVKPVGERLDSRYVEFYDTRACDDAFDRLRHQGLQDGVMEIVFAWDTSESGGSREGGRGDYDEGYRGGGRGRGRGGRGRGAGRGRGYDDFDDRRGGDFGRDREARGRGGRYDDDYGGGRGGRGGHGGFGDRYDGGGGRGGYPNVAPGPYGAPSNMPPPNMPPANMPSGNVPSGYNAPPPPSAGAPPADDRLEQARKVQQLLAALKQPQTSAPAAPPSGPPAPGVPPMAAMQQPPPPGAPGYYPPPPAPGIPGYPGAVPPSSAYTGLPPPTSAPPQSAPPPANPALNNLPPNILALLRSVQPGNASGGMPPPGQYGAPPPGMMNTPPPPPPGSTAQANAQYQQLMSYLQAQAGGKP